MATASTIWVTVKKNELSPLALRWTVTPSVAIPSLASSVVTSAVFTFERENGETGTWTATIVSQTATALVLRHPWEAGDVPTVEHIRVWPVLTTTLGGSPVAGVAKTLNVVER